MRLGRHLRSIATVGTLAPLLLACAQDPAPGTTPAPIAGAAAVRPPPGPAGSTDGTYAGTYAPSGVSPNCPAIQGGPFRVVITGGRFTTRFFRNEVAGTVEPDGTVRGVSSGGRATMSGRIEGNRFTAQITYPAQSGGRGTNCYLDYTATRA